MQKDTERTIEIFSLSKAAEEVQKSKSTIFNAIKTGRLKANKNGSIYEIHRDDLLGCWRCHAGDSCSDRAAAQ